MANRYKTMAPKFSSVRANAAAVEAAAQQAEKSGDKTSAVITNPYAAPALDEEGQELSAGPSKRSGRKMQFSAPGKYVKQGDQLRNEAKLEALKARIAEQSRKAGLDSEFDVLERSLRRQAPPAVEWWDEAILPDPTYDSIPSALEYIETNPDSLVTHLVQHPIPIVAQSDRKQAERGLMLTKKEARKMRRQRRLAELEDKRDKQKMGLIPPDPPKVRLANIVKVLANESSADPTKIENQVRKQVAMRAIRHEKDNAARALTKEQKREKLYAKLEEKERRQGLVASAYIVKHLTNQRHKFKVRQTAKQDHLTGCVLFTPTFSIVLVEGVAKMARHYHQLMTHRIDWTEQLRRRDGDEDSDDSGSEAGDKEKKDDEEDIDLSDNKCEQIWHAEVPERVFGGFIARHAETDARGKDILGPKYELLWDLAKRWTYGGEEF
jgi:U4/U6 small nuclear ribonucleoprotein PRP3